jgi:DNA-binding MarR family transcriptional regulator
MGIFDRIQGEIEDRDKKEGISPADLLELSPPLRKLMNRITREGEIDENAAAEHLEETPANTLKMLNTLVEKGYLEREKRKENWIYKIRFARKRGRDIPAGIWSALEQKTEEK